jgi:DNA end-binding protein Ku
MARPIWTGFLRLSLVSCPVTLTPATSASSRIHLHEINPETGNRVHQRLVDEETGKEVERANLVRGYEVKKGTYVTLTPEELDAIKIESSQVLDLKTFVDRDAVDPLYWDAPYFIYPQKSGIEAYQVIAKAMAEENRVAIGRIVMARHEHPVMVEAFRDGLLTTTLRAANEVREPEYGAKGKPATQMVSLAKDIMRKLEGTWKPNTFRDEYQDALLSLVKAKQKGREPKLPEIEAPKSNVVDLMSVLKRSLAEGKHPSGTERRATSRHPSSKQKRAKHLKRA